MPRKRSSRILPYRTICCDIIATENAQLKTFGADQEVNVFQAFKTCFPNADHLLCWTRSKDNAKRKLTDLKLRFPKSYINEIFGEEIGNVKVKGLSEEKSMSQNGRASKRSG